LALANVLFILLILSFVTYPPHADSAYVMMLKIIAQNTTSKHLSLKPRLRNSESGFMQRACPSVRLSVCMSVRLSVAKI